MELTLTVWGARRSDTVFACPPTAETMDALEMSLKSHFCTAANDVTKLYMDGVKSIKRAHRCGKQVGQGGGGGGKGLEELVGAGHRAAVCLHYWIRVKRVTSIF